MGDGKALIEQMQVLVRHGAPAESEVTTGATTLRFFDHDRYSATLRELVVAGAAPLDGEARAFLSSRAAEIARRLSFLEEPLAVWELDGNEGAAQLRSSPPQREGEELSFWEVQLSTPTGAAGSSARLARYRWAPGMAERESLAYPATFALLGRLADALALALAEPVA